MIAAHGLPCRVLEGSEADYYARHSRSPSARSIRHVRLTDVIRQVHTASRGTNGIRRVHADLTLGVGTAVGHQAIELLMRRAGIQGISGRPRFPRVDRQFHRDHPDQLQGAGLERHEALFNRAEMKRAPPSTCRSRTTKLGQPDPGDQVRVDSGSDNAETGGHRPTVWVRQARREGEREKSAN